MWNSSSEWKRVTPNIDKKILIKVCLISLKNSIISFLSKYKLKFNIHLIHDGSDNEFNDNLIKYFVLLHGHYIFVVYL